MFSLGDKDLGRLWWSALWRLEFSSTVLKVHKIHCISLDYASSTRELGRSRGNQCICVSHALCCDISNKQSKSIWSSCLLWVRIYGYMAEQMFSNLGIESAWVYLTMTFSTRLLNVLTTGIRGFSGFSGRISLYCLCYFVHLSWRLLCSMVW